LLDLSSTTAAKLNLTYPGFGIATLASDSTGALLLQADEANTQASSLIQFKVDGSERVRIDSSGRVGIGTTSPQELFHVNTGASGGQVLRMSTNGTDIGYLYQNTGGVILGAYSTRFLGFETNGSERARIDSSGRLLVGTSSAQGQSIFQAVGNSSASTDPGDIRVIRGLNISSIGTNVGAELGIIKFGALENSVCAQISAVCDANWSAGDTPGRLVFSTTADGASSPTERMRITNLGVPRFFSSDSGLIQAISAGSATNENIFVGSHSATSNTTGSNCILIKANGDIQNTNNSYTGISDIKLKENIVDAGSQWDDLKALRVVKYNLKPETNQETHTQIGLIAQEVELVCPRLVKDNPDRDAEGNDLGTVTKSVNYSVLYMKAVKVLQEAMERIEALEAKIAALEGA
jgi:hypothetical protein